MVSEKDKVASLSTIRRLPSYLHLLRQLHTGGRDFASTTHIAQSLQLNPDQIRKDLAFTGIAGKPKVGYHIPTLIEAIEEFLCWNNSTDAFLVGAGNLGSALLGYKGFRQHGLNIAAAFDTDNSKIGRMIGDLQVLPLEKLPDLAQRMHIHMGIIAVPTEQAQEVAEIMAAAGIVAIWNFAPTSLQLPESVVVQQEDISSGLAVLSVKLNRILKGSQGGNDLPE